MQRISKSIEVRLGVDYLAEKAELDRLAKKVIYTGPIYAYFGFSLGTLEYRSARFETETLDGKDEEGNDLPKTVISREYSSEWKPGDEPYYPVNDERNSALYAQYNALADKEENVVLGGRIGEYKYYDMDQVIAAALEKAEKMTFEL